jgi:hypothetical protein
MFAVIDGVAEGERPGFDGVAFRLIPDPDIIAYRPAALVVLEVCKEPRLDGVLHHVVQCALAAVVVGTVEIGDALTFHVGLSSQDEDLDWAYACLLGDQIVLRGTDPVGHSCQQNGSHHPARHLSSCCFLVGHLSLLLVRLAYS